MNHLITPSTNWFTKKFLEQYKLRSTIALIYCSNNMLFQIISVCLLWIFLFQLSKKIETYLFLILSQTRGSPLFMYTVTPRCNRHISSLHSSSRMETFASRHHTCMINMTISNLKCMFFFSFLHSSGIIAMVFVYAHHHTPMQSSHNYFAFL